MIVLVRHGEATHHTMHLTGGWTDSELTDKGSAQMRKVARRLAADLKGRDAAFRLLCSDLKRARQSAAFIAEAVGGLKVEPFAFLREKNNGEAAGLTESAARRLYRQPATTRELDHRNYPGGETRREFFVRNVEGLKENADWEKENLIIVAHKGTIQNIIFAWMGMDIQQVSDFNFSLDILPSSVSVLGINKWNEHAIFLLNMVPHPHPEGGYGIFEFKFSSIDASKQK